MKINWSRLWNPNNIDFKKLKLMSNEELQEYREEILAGEKAKIWVKFAWLTNYLCVSNVWQYIIVVWMGRI